MAKPRLLLWSVYLSSMLLFLVQAASEPVSAQNTMPNSSRECAICHIRWVDALVRNGQREDLMETVLDRQAGSGDMCLSCHDGSVVDSRFKVWSTRHHTTDSAPSPAVTIPTDTFPLDEQGRMTCATCHTAHAVPDSSDLKTVIFLRQPNVDSSLCLACHPEHAAKNAFQHPLGRADNLCHRQSWMRAARRQPTGTWSSARHATNRTAPPTPGCSFCPPPSSASPAIRTRLPKPSPLPARRYIASATHIPASSPRPPCWKRTRLSARTASLVAYHAIVSTMLRAPSPC